MNIGRLTNTEKDYIKKNFQRLSYQEMAQKLDRRVEPIRKYVEKTLGKNLVSSDEIADKAEYDIRRRPYWKDLEKQFDKDELEMFLFHWKKINSQFKEDVFHTEEIQLIDAIKLDILMNRMLKQQHQIKTAVEGFQATIVQEQNKPPEDQNIAQIQNLQIQIASLMAAQEGVEKSHKDFMQEKNRILKDLKATREQRIKRLEESSSNFSSWLTQILNDGDLRRNLGMRMEKMRLAMEVERARLSEYHKYNDQELDIPFLTPEVVLEKEKE